MSDPIDRSGLAPRFWETKALKDDLKFSSGVGSDAIVFANWSIAFGSNALSQNASNSHCIKRLQDPYSVLHNANMLLDRSEEHTSELQSR